MLNENTVQAYEDQKEKGSTDCWRIKTYQIIRTHTIHKASGTMGITAREVIEALHCHDVNLVRPEITRLIKDRIVRICGKTKCKFTGKSVYVLEWTGAAYFSHGNWKKKEAKSWLGSK